MKITINQVLGWNSCEEHETRDLIPEKQLHLLACDFAEDVLPIFETQYPDDPRPRLAIEAKRKWIKGEIGDDELAGAAAGDDTGEK